MPIYEYECLENKHRFERLQSFSEAPVSTCPECGSPVRKVLQPVGIVFKGSGWYKTDSRGGSSNGKADTAKETAADTPAEAKAAGEVKTDGAAKAESSGGKKKSDGGSGKPDTGSKPAPTTSGSTAG
jgi:putative FmdB family regulatory protein